MQAEKLRLFPAGGLDTWVLAQSALKEGCASAHCAEKENLGRRAESHAVTG
jgi:hypothetical protein